MTNVLAEAYSTAIRGMANNAPKDLVRRALIEAEDLDPSLDASEDRMREYVAAAPTDDPLRRALHLNIARWDNAPAEGNPWTNQTPANSEVRRATIMAALGLSELTAKEFAQYFPISHQNGPTVIAAPWDPWYSDEIRRDRAFYWTHYENYLREGRGWSEDSILDLDRATNHVVERLIDPARPKPGQTKGLVVGYVQSGKTANFTGVIAKAIDAGYRLIIVMTGTTNLLREQTQRRVDMELVGRENVLRGADESDETARQRIDYLDDDDWVKGRFVSHGVRPSDVGQPDIYRMTTRNFDYRKLQQGLPALEFERRDPKKPLWHPENLYASGARLIIVKKNSAVLNNMVKDLKATGDRLADIPTLIIDDESDQASINTTDPKTWTAENKKRTAINRHISNLLSMLPRAQYIGYTATPFANVFVDPHDAGDIFPKDYLIALERPLGYMGASDFHDMDSSLPDNEKTFANSAEKAHLRILNGQNNDEDVEEERQLQNALDSFVLAGAIKLFRQDIDPEKYSRPFRHHTMLVHETMRKVGHRSRADAIRDKWRTGGYLTGSALSRLRTLYSEDFAPVTDALKFGDPMPSSFDELAPRISRAARQIAPNGVPVLIVNSEKDIEQEELDFDKRPVWRILVGGNKLARGFTVEGLTVTYYSRNAGHAEALMQMGRWFGFRPGYRDLVRLFITAGVRDALEAACWDEEDFRAELRQYAVMVDGRPTVTPEDVQPLVPRHGLRPTAPNKMRNAELVERRTLSKEPSSGYPATSDQALLDANIDACLPLLRAAKKSVQFPAASRPFDALTGLITHEQMVDVLKNLTWKEPKHFAADLAWIAALPDEIIREWRIVMPQLKNRKKVNIRGVGSYSVHGRVVDPKGYIRGNADGEQRKACDHQMESTEYTGFALLYPVIDKAVTEEEIADDGYPQGVVMALSLRLPRAAAPKDRNPLVYRVKNRAMPKYAIVDTD
ncbi:Z1 domain-containing protein [Nocardia nova]|uniref:Z1 domain-containing protein n=1 Tax=Nocardia nova TaxID=37330 RepID=UPI001C497BC2|nr:Z1 domain-containing protein [Nocardia nova]MBV7705442.1 Z1 domain-containing protein [Nocardia nova]